ncbi:E3 ubiquitin-protein ligase arih1-like [Ruditapes philippinarum]|uniref:E3 ubiquitin-protein ligase arih1-like n=1 Tax=Ruditapes philippinarum TaxID=129788 RepID=UPI00295A750A|nr:E3 ubiquitin-protein ligase arih1-like [Ruditapes philippinarum]
MGDKTSSDHGEMTAQKQAPSYSEANYLKTLEWMEASSKESFEIYSRTKRKLYDLHNKPRAKNYSKHKEIAYDFSKKKPDVYLLDTSKFRSDDIGSNTDSGENLRSDLQTSDPDDNVPRLTLLQLSKSAETGNVNEAHKAGFRNEKPIPDNVPPPPPLLSLDRSCSLPQAPLPLERSCSLPPRSLTTSESQSIPVPPPPPSIQWRPPNQRGIVTRSPIVRPKTKQSDLTDAEEQSPGPSSNQENDDDIELEVAREVFRTMIGNVRPFIPMGENEPNPDRMQLEELQTAIMDLRYLEQAMFEADEFMDLDFDEFGGFNFELPHFSEKSVEPSFARGDEVITECLICYDEVKLHKRLCCDYPACDNCMEQYIETNVTQGVVKIPCLGHESCNAFIYRDEILGRLSVPMKDKYYKFLVDANKDPKVKTCPRCSNITQITDEQSEKKTKYGLLITCSECHFDWCFECQAPWHNGIKCKEFRKGDKLVKSWAKEKHYGNTNAQKCPKCKIFIERKGGCDHMVCLKCDTGFCYKCGGRYLDMKVFREPSQSLQSTGM